LRAFGPDTVIVSAEGLVSAIAPRSQMQVPTAAPRLVLLGVGADGKVQVAFNPAAVGNGAGDAVYAARARMVFMNNGAGAQPFFLNDDGSYSQNLPPAATDAPLKPLEDVKFDAYDLSGKAVAREAALKRLKAGG